MYIYLDESGDLGFDFRKRKTTKRFVITLLVCETQQALRALHNAVERTLRHKVCRRKKRSSGIELKGSNTSIGIKTYFIRQLEGDGWHLYSVILDKKRVEDYLRAPWNRNKLYNFLARFLIEKLPLRETLTNVRLTVDKSKNKDDIRDFNQYIQNQIEGILPLNTGFSIEHLISHESFGLQAVDLFCWGIARKYERADKQWYDMFKHKIQFETEYLQ
jgi:hypothetical protein